MSKLEQLIQQYCPDGVEYKPLVECCNILDGKRKPIAKGARQSGQYPYYGANGIQDWVSDYIFDGSYVLVGEDGSVITENGTPVVNWAQGKIWVNNHAHIIAEKSGVLLRYLFYYIQIIDIHNLVHGNIPKLTQGDLKELEIPVPPLPVQEEIVRILDTFTELQAELQAELQKRKQQYNYYRDNLLSFEGRTDVEWKKLGDCIKSLNTGLNPRQFFKLNTDDATNWYVTIREIQHNTIIMNEGTDRMNDEALRLCNNRSNLEKGDVLFSGTGTIGEVAALEETPTNWNIKEGVYAIKPIPTILNYRFLMFILQSGKIRQEYLKKAAGGTVKSVPMGEMKKIDIPVPSLSEQQNIVDILDKFDTLTNDLTAGLPAEIEKRRQQYEYYRDKLLTFKRKEA